MTIKEITDKALRYAVSDDELRPVLSQPRTLSERTYASDGIILIGIANDMCENYTGEDKYPDVHTVLDTAGERICQISIGLIQPVKEDRKSYNCVNVAGFMIRDKIYNKLRRISLCLGIDAWNVLEDKCKLQLETSDGKIRMLVMPSISFDKFIGFVKVTKDEEAMWSKERAEANINMILSVEEAEESQRKKEYEQKKREIYSFRITRSATMYVAARDEEEAKKIADDHMDDIDDWDFELDDRPESMELMGEAEDYMETIYTEDGETSYDDYIEEEE